MKPTDPPPTNPLSLYALGAAICLLMPVAWVLSIVALWQIKNRPEKGDGAPFAIMAFILSAVLCPGAIWLIAYTPPGKALDGCRQVQNEGAAELRLIGYLQEGYFEASGRYGTLKEIGFRNINGGPYEHVVVEADATHYRLRATGQNQMAGDILEYSEKKKLVKAHNLCRPAPDAPPAP